jgi:acetyl esterase/lipase
MRIKKISIAGCALSIFLLVGCRVEDPLVRQSMDELAPDDITYPSPTDTISYRSSPTRLLDVYPAQGDNPSRIAVLYAHGGGWVENDRTEAATNRIFRHLLEEGYVGFSIDYTLARELGVSGAPDDCAGTESPFPDNLHDLQWAIGWANQPVNKALYKYDRVVVVGESAGGFLAGLAAVKSDQRPAGMPTAYVIRPDAAVTLVAPMHMKTWGSQGDGGADGFANWVVAFTNYIHEKLGGTGDYNPLQCLYGWQYTTTNSVPLATREAATASEYVDAGDPPIYMVSGTDDMLALSEHNADLLEQEYANKGFNGRAWNDRAEGGFHNAGRLNTNAVVLRLFLNKLANGDFD